ncbi:hypothetical protein M5X00_29480 [Paenibacillus alvei]|uniref:hypothetical protein n=1 Tax=Paenibacillus alvei TaxID=44250 RepID=UPI00028979D2|nr:hypothetical protein [Paenibacillus alvei]EJW14038.1 hypothetical protein PAV_141p01440 [Paenibacillus alvei DSM 29]MCY9545106.1 hypothetical protein [Paenibacillus alvei]MCY9707609.1 hypothetical protein [Paenibacillus alvei]MCY9758352.1 hypothetical protein [Paenibacillus alvei]MEC0082681.1 hypothetical protein [Paenibacillus alvei]
MNKLSDSLNYSLVTIEERMELVDKIVKDNDEELVDYYDNHYNPHINQTGLLSENTRVAKDLETLASYLLYAKDSDASEDTITDYRQKRNNNREASIEKLMKVREVRKETNRSIIKTPKIKVCDKDRVNYQELEETGVAIKRITHHINSGVDSKGRKLSISEIKKLKWIRTDIQKDEIAVKNELKGYIRFQNITKSDPDFHQLEFIRFDDVETMRVLLEDYAELKEYSYDDTFGYLKIIMFAFEELIDKTEIKDYMKDILVWKVEGQSYDEMIEALKDKYNIKMTKPRLSKITRETLPTMIAETYKQQREDWVYTYAIRGEYKTCNCCKNNYLATKKYFSPNKRSKSGLRPICKNCRKDKYQNDSVAKNV